MGRKLRPGIVFFVGTVLALAGAVGARSGGGKDERPAKADRDAATILVKFAADADASEEIAAIGDEPLGKTKNRVHVVKVKAGKDLDERLAEYRSRSDVLFAEPNYLAHASALGAPADPSYSQQWALPKIQALDGWSLYPGAYGTSGGPTIAVVDTGVQSTHPDLAGQVDTANAANCVNSSSTCASASGLDDEGHGTHVAGIAAAATNNGTGVAGTAFSSLVMPVKALDSGGSGTYAAIANGILWASGRGARVINLSLGGYSYSATLCDAVAQATAAGALVVAAAGNEGTSKTIYPAGCPGAVGVAATSQTDGSPSWSNYGAPDVFVSAPGVSIYSTYPTSSYASLSGTSMATPFVAGLSALLFGQVPSRTPADVKVVLASTADKVGGVTYGSTDPYGTCGCSFHPWYGYGRINLYRALGAAGPAQPGYSLAVTPASRTVTAGAGTTYSVDITPSGGFAETVSLTVAGLPSGASASFSPNPTSSSSTLSVATSAATPAGTYPLTIGGTSESGVARTTSATLTVEQPGFTVAASPTYVSVKRRNSASYSIAVARTGGFSSPVALSVSGLPANTTAAFTPNPATDSATFVVATSSSTRKGTYVLTLTGTAGGLSRTVQVTLKVG
ncbi:MAG: S8 family serine peptidase [Gaiellaceae bacterium]